MRGAVSSKPFLAPSRYVDTRATGRVRVFEDRSAAGPLVVLVHDLAAPSGLGSMQPLFDELRSHRAVAAVELPGCGMSTEPAQPYERTSYVRALGAVFADLARWQGGMLDVVAAGVGGELAARATLLPDGKVVRSLAVVAPTGFGPAALAARALGERAFVMTTTVLAAFGWSTPAVADPWVADDVYEDLEVRLAFLHGEHAPLAARARLDALAARKPRVRRMDVAGARACPHVDASGATRSALQSFWSTLDARPALRLIQGGRTRAPVVHGPGRHAARTR